MVRSLVLEHGGSRREASAAATAAAELAQNIVVHADGRGEVWAWLHTGELIVVARDRGPGLPPVGAVHVRRARAGLGEGAGAVTRLMDEVQVRTRTRGGLEVTARKRLAAPREVRWR